MVNGQSSILRLSECNEKHALSWPSVSRIETKSQCSMFNTKFSFSVLNAGYLLHQSSICDGGFAIGFASASIRTTTSATSALSPSDGRHHWVTGLAFMDRRLYRFSSSCMSSCHRSTPSWSGYRTMRRLASMRGCSSCRLPVRFPSPQHAIHMFICG